MLFSDVDFTKRLSTILTSKATTRKKKKKKMGCIIGPMMEAKKKEKRIKKMIENRRIIENRRMFETENEESGTDGSEFMSRIGPFPEEIEKLGYKKKKEVEIGELREELVGKEEVVLKAREDIVLRIL